ncbi:hypothetical protein F2981_33525 (plasmid) [Sinorhizobium meliloti]|nr:hypothetical protein [Sinorhizobium meliloti]
MILVAVLADAGSDDNARENSDTRYHDRADDFSTFDAPPPMTTEQPQRRRRRNHQHSAVYLDCAVGYLRVYRAEPIATHSRLLSGSGPA